MFFADRIQLRPTDRVLEIGPGACPHPRSDVLLEKRFSTTDEAFDQRGRTEAVSYTQPLIYYDGDRFPFRDQEFDYVICSHVLEHVADVEHFCAELTRVAARGYLEFPTIYYDYLYDIPEHVTLLFWHEGTLHHLPKQHSGIPDFAPVTRFFFHTLQSGHDALIQAFKPWFFQGFQWEHSLPLRQAKSIAELCQPLAVQEKPVPRATTTELTTLIFSKDRAMQLDALLASLYLHCQEPQLLQLKVLFTYSNDCHACQYHELAAAYPAVEFIAETDFSAELTTILQSTAKILFMVDDTLVVRRFSAQQLCELLDAHPTAAGVSLRLGRNTTYCYALQIPQSLPTFAIAGEHFLRYDWTFAQADFGYPLEVSSSCYRSPDILQALAGSSVANPNELEGALATNARNTLLPMKRQLICPEHSIAFSCPLNVVQTVCANRFDRDQGCSAGLLAALFAQGRRIAVDTYRDFVPNACHQPVELWFR